MLKNIFKPNKVNTYKIGQEVCIKFEIVEISEYDEGIAYVIKPKNYPDCLSIFVDKKYLDKILI